MFEWLKLIKRARIKIEELKREIKILRWEVTLIQDELDYEERRRGLAELNLSLALEKKVNGHDHI